MLHATGPLRLVQIGFALVALWVGASATNAQSVGEPPCRADYRIEARLDAATMTLSGTETIRWHNKSRDDVHDLWFHLYWNAFANNRSTVMHEARGELRGVAIENDWGWQRVLSIEVDGEDVTKRIHYRQPDDDRSEDRTVFSVPLGKLAKTGTIVEARITWEAKIPRVRRRTGFKDDFLLIAQWFPKLGVYETGNGWNCHQFHASTEFFSDYGTYDVTLDLPAEYEGKIGASGVQSEPSRVVDGRVIARFMAPSEKDRERRDKTGKLPLVHDFTWTGDPDYVKYSATFHYDEWAARFAGEVARVATALERPAEDLRVRDVDVTVLLQPEHADQGARHFDATCTALFFYSLWFGEYPYEHITVVDPAWGGGAAGGMEYPTLFTAGSRKFTWTSMFSPESVTVHECGHQFWYGLVGNNEFEAAWMDEGFNTYTQNEALIRRYGLRHRTTDFASIPFDGVPLAREPGGSAFADAIALRRWSLPRGITLEPVKSSGFVDWWRQVPMLSFGRMRDDPRWTERTGYLADPDSDPVNTPGWRYVDRASYRQNSYARPSVALRSLCGLVGFDHFMKGMRQYAETWRYAHPYPDDFYETFNTGAGIDVGWYFEQAFESTATVDWQLEVDQKAVDPLAGYVQNAEGVFERVEREKDATDATEKLDDADDTDKNEARASNGESNETFTASKSSDKKKPWRIDVVVRRKGSLMLPLKLALEYDDGTSESLIWSREEQARSTWWKPLSGREPMTKKLVSAAVDPDRLYSFDRDMSNNEWHEKRDEVAPLRWSERVFTQLSHLLHWYGGLGG